MKSLITRLEFLEKSKDSLIRIYDLNKVDVIEGYRGTKAYPTLFNIGNDRKGECGKCGKGLKGCC